MRSEISLISTSLHALGPPNTQKTELFYGNGREPGLVVLMLNRLFSCIETYPENILYTVTFSFWEMNHNNVVDLLNPELVDVSRHVRRHPDLGVFITNLTEIQVKSWSVLESYLESAISVSQNMAMVRGIRWHSFLKLNIYREDEEHPELTIKSSLLFANMKGTDRHGKLGVKGQALKDGSLLNQSISALYSAVHKIVTYANRTIRNANDRQEARKNIHKEVFNFFGDSKVAAVLSESLSGNCCTTMMGTIAPTELHYLETMDTLENLRMTKHIPVSPQRGIIETELSEMFRKIQRFMRNMKPDPLYEGHPPTEEQERLEKMKDLFGKLIEGKSMSVIMEENATEEISRLKELDPQPLNQEEQLWKQNEMRSLRHGSRHTIYVRDQSSENVRHTYKGQWEKNVKSGEGEFINSKIRYKGGWKDNKKHGFGVMWVRESTKSSKANENNIKSSWRRVYRGEWKNGMKHGQGICYYKDGAIYDGEWREDERSGSGIMYLTDGSKVEGQFVNDKENGHCTRYEKNGDRFEGQFMDGKKSGPGMFYFVNDRQILKGEWFEDVFRSGEFFNDDDDDDDKHAIDDKARRIPRIGLLDPQRVVREAAEGNRQRIMASQSG